MATPTLTDETRLGRFFGSSTRLDQFTNADSDVLAEAISAASSIAANALYARHTTDSVDALTAATCPDELQRHVNATAAEILTSGGRGRPEAVQEDADNARAYFAAVRAGTVSVEGLTPLDSSVSDSEGSGSVRFRAPAELRFDRGNESQKYNSKFREIP